MKSENEVRWSHELQRELHDIALRVRGPYMFNRVYDRVLTHDERVWIDDKRAKDDWFQQKAFPTDC